jgi:hypothetical protein
MIYVIHCDGYCKIGMAVDPLKRMGDLQVANPHPLSMVWAGGVTTAQPDSVTERQLHAHFAAKRVRGEWFILDDDDLAYIHELDRPATLAFYNVGRPEPDARYVQNPQVVGDVSIDDVVIELD